MSLKNPPIAHILARKPPEIFLSSIKFKIRNNLKWPCLKKPDGKGFWFGNMQKATEKRTSQSLSLAGDNRQRFYRK